MKNNTEWGLMKTLHWKLMVFQHARPLNQRGNRVGGIINHRPWACSKLKLSMSIAL